MELGINKKILSRLVIFKVPLYYVVTSKRFVHVGLVLRQFDLWLSSLMPLANLHHFLIYTLSFSI